MKGSIRQRTPGSYELHHRHGPRRARQAPPQIRYHLGNARSAVAVRRVFSQLPLSRVEGSFSVAFSVVRASLAAFMLAGKVVVLRRGLWLGLWSDRRVKAVEERVNDIPIPVVLFVDHFSPPNLPNYCISPMSRAAMRLHSEASHPTSGHPAFFRSAS